jgi:hypothetical protein
MVIKLNSKSVLAVKMTQARLQLETNTRTWPQVPTYASDVGTTYVTYEILINTI